MCIRLPSSCLAITTTVDVFTDRYLETGVCLTAYCIATAVLVRFEVSVQQRVYMPQYIKDLRKTTENTHRNDHVNINRDGLGILPNT
jgi:hypothetical protein